MIRLERTRTRRLLRHSRCPGARPLLNPSRSGAAAVTAGARRALPSERISTSIFCARKTTGSSLRWLRAGPRIGPEMGQKWTHNESRRNAGLLNSRRSLRHSCCGRLNDLRVAARCRCGPKSRKPRQLSADGASVFRVAGAGVGRKQTCSRSPPSWRETWDRTDRHSSRDSVSRPARA